MEIYGLTPGEVQDRKICDNRWYDLNLTRRCLRFNDLALFTVFDSFSNSFLPCQCLFSLSK